MGSFAEFHWINFNNNKKDCCKKGRLNQHYGNGVPGTPLLSARTSSTSNIAIISIPVPLLL